MFSGKSIINIMCYDDIRVTILETHYPLHVHVVIVDVEQSAVSNAVDKWQDSRHTNTRIIGKWQLSRFYTNNRLLHLIITLLHAAAGTLIVVYHYEFSLQT